MKIYKNNKSGLAKVEYMDKYYKYEYTENIDFDFSDTNNQKYITDNCFTPGGAVSAWTVTQNYNLYNPVCVKDITTSCKVTYVQANSGVNFKVTAITTANEEIILADHNFGFNMGYTDADGPDTPYTEKKIFDHPFQTISKIIIYVDVYRRSDKWSFGNCEIRLKYTKVNKLKGTADDYNYIVNIPKTFLIDEKENKQWK